MTHRLFLRWPAHADQPLHWVELDNQARMLASGHVALSELATLKQLAASRELLVMLPASMTLITPVNVPSKQQKHLARVLPFLIEDVLTAAIDDMHVVAGPKLDNDRYLVIAMARNALQQVLDQLAAAHLTAAVITVDALCLPGNEACLLLEADESLLRLQDGQVQTLPTPDLDTMLPLLLQDQPCSVWRSDATLPSPTDMAVSDIESATFWLAASWHKNLPDLLQGDFTSRRTRDAFWLQWRLPVMMATAAALLLYINLIADWWLLHRQHLQLQQAEIAAYRTAFPGTEEVANPFGAMKGQMRQYEGAGGPSFLSTLEQVSNVIAQSGVTVHHVGYEADHGDFSLDVTASDLPALNALQTAFASNGMSVEMGQAAAAEGGYSGRLMIKGGSKGK